MTSPELPGGISLADPGVLAGGFLAELLDRLDDVIVLSRAENLAGEWCPRVVHVNQAFTDLTGYTREEAVGSLPSRWARQEDNPGAHTQIRDTLAAGECARLELIVRRRDDTTVRSEAVVGHLGRDIEGRHYFIEVSRDVTEWRRDEQFLREAHDVARVGSWEYDVDRNVVRWSDELYRIFGVRPEQFEATFEGYLQLVHPEDRETVAANVARTLETGRPFAAEYRIVQPAGEIRWLHSRGRLIESPDRRRMVGTCQDITEQRALQEALTHRALHDPLTGLPNRALLEDRVQLALGRAGRKGSAVAVVFIDLDRFKQINDRLGHAAGDRVLATVGARLLRVVRPSDTIARYGGDEFVAICDDVGSSDTARALGRRITTALDVPVELDDGRTVGVSASIGISVGTGDKPAAKLFAEADAAMYAAKASGGGSILLANTD